MNVKKFLVVILTFLITFCFCACTAEKEDVSDNQSDIQSEIDYSKKYPRYFSVTVVDDNGEVVEGVILQIRKDSKITACTNREGIAKFPVIPSSGYKLSVVSCPDGYEYTGDRFIILKQGTSEYTLNITKKVGDINEN